MDNITDGLNDMQIETLQQFKKNIADVIQPEDSDAILLKWLRTRNFNLRKTEKLYRQNLACREVHQVDSYVDNFVKPEVCQEYEFSAHLGYAKDGTPISYVAMGRGDIKGFIMSLHTFDLSKFCSVIIESDLQRVRQMKLKTGKEINEILYIVDMEGLPLQQCCHTCVIEMGLDSFRMFQEHYPEIWKYLFIVNAPSYFYTAFNLFRNIFSMNFMKKVRVVSREATPNLLLKYIDPEVLPAFLGGKRVDSNGDPMCSEFLKFGGLIPEKYYLRNRVPLQPTENGVESFWLSQRGFYNYPIVVREAYSIVTVELRFEGGSVSTTMLYKPFGSDPDNVDIPPRDEYIDEQDDSCEYLLASPKQKVQGHLAPVDNFVIAPWPGIYVWKFDNSYNWFTSRKVICRFKVLPPRTPLPSKYNMLGYIGPSF